MLYGSFSFKDADWLFQFRLFSAENLIFAETLIFISKLIEAETQTEFSPKLWLFISKLIEAEAETESFSGHYLS